MFRKRGRKKQKKRFVYLNFGDGSDEAKFQDLELAFAFGADVVACGEHADRVDVTTRFVKRHPEYDLYYGDGRSGAAKECLIYKKDLGQVMLRKTITLVGARKLPKGAGPENAGPKCALRVRIRREGRRRLHLIVAHQYATVNNRREAAWLFMNSLMDVVRARRGVVVFFGDLNAEPRHALIRALRALFTGSSAPESGPTHHRRLIDYVMIKGGDIIEAFTRHISSDHEMVVLDVLI